METENKKILSIIIPTYNAALMYEAVQRKYKVFWLFNKLHVSNSFYENQFAKLLEFAKRVGRADRLYRK